MNPTRQSDWHVTSQEHKMCLHSCAGGSWRKGVGVDLSRSRPPVAGLERARLCGVWGDFLETPGGWLDHGGVGEEVTHDKCSHCRTPTGAVVSCFNQSCVRSKVSAQGSATTGFVWAHYFCGSA